MKTWERHSPSTLSNLPYTINSASQSAHFKASICATKNINRCDSYMVTERNLFAHFSLRSLPEIIWSHLINCCHWEQLQSENHHYQKRDQTSCWWNLSTDDQTERFRKRTAAPLHCRRTNLQAQSCHREWLSQNQPLHSWCLQPHLQWEHTNHIPNRSPGAKICNAGEGKNPMGSMTILVLQHMAVKLPFLVYKSYTSHSRQQICTLLPPFSP